MRKVLDQSHQQLLACQRMCEKVFQQSATRQFIQACGNLSNLEYLGIQLDRVNARLTTAAVCFNTEQVIKLGQRLEEVKLELKQDSIYPSAGVYPVCEGVREPPAKVGQPAVDIEGDQMVISWKDDDNCPESLVKYEICINDLIIDMSAKYRSVSLGYPKVVPQPGKLYTFQVRAVNGRGPGEWSEHTIARFKTAPPSKPARPKVTTGYTNAKVSVLIPDIELSNGAHVTKLIIEYCNWETSSQWTPVELPVEMTPAEKVVNIRKLARGTIYYFRVIFVNECGQSRPSDSVQMKTDPPISGVPTDVRPSSYYTSSMLKIRWNPPYKNAKFVHSYKVKYKRKKHEHDTKRPFEIIETKKLSAKVEKLKSDTTYVFFVSAVNVNDKCSPEVEIEAETRWKKKTKVALSPLVWLGTTTFTTFGSPAAGAFYVGETVYNFADNTVDAVAGGIVGLVGGVVLAPLTGVFCGTVVTFMLLDEGDHSDQSDDEEN